MLSATRLNETLLTQDTFKNKVEITQERKIKNKIIIKNHLFFLSESEKFIIVHKFSILFKDE